MQGFPEVADVFRAHGPAYRQSHKMPLRHLQEIGDGHGGQVSRTRGSRWSGIMVITAMSAGETEKRKMRMNGFPRFWNQANPQKSTGRTGPDCPPWRDSSDTERIERRYRKTGLPLLIFGRPGLGQGSRRFILRHTFNTNMRKAGVERSVIMKITGHKTMSMFERYNTVDRDDAHKAIKRLDDYCREADGLRKRDFTGWGGTWWDLHKGNSDMKDFVRR